MKTFKQYLNESANEVLELIKRDCAPFLEESKKAGFLYRGIQPDGEDLHVNDSDGKKLVYIQKRVRQDRVPRDMPKPAHHALDDWFDKKFGIKARSQCVFAYGGELYPRGTIKEYGDAHIIFPIGEMQYVWSPEIEDLFVSMEADEITSREDVIRLVDESGYKSTGLDEAMKFGNEIMIKCNKYYAFPAEYKAELKKSLGFS